MRNLQHALALVFTLAFSMLATGTFGQTIPKNGKPRFSLERATSATNGVLAISFGVSMSDCISEVEIENTRNGKKYLFKPSLDNYYVRDNDMEEIFAKFEVGKFRKLVHKKEGLVANITIKSKAGRVIYKGVARYEIAVDDEEEYEDNASTALNTK